MTSEARRTATSQQGLRPDTPYADVLLTIGRIVAAHGLRGEVKLVFTTDRPEKMSELRRVYLNGSSEAIRIGALRLRGNDREAILKLQGINDRTSAEALRGTVVQIRANQLPPPESGSFFYYQILGLRAIDEGGLELGQVTDIIDAGEVDVYVVTDAEGNETLFPALLEVIIEIDPNEGYLIVRPQEYA